MTNRRKGQDPIPYNLDDYLNEDQQYELKRLEAFGWSLSFVRRPPGEPHTVVISNGNESEFVVLDDAGNMVRDSGFKMRSHREIDESTAPQPEAKTEPTEVVASESLADEEAEEPVPPAAAAHEYHLQILARERQLLERSMA